MFVKFRIGKSTFVLRTLQIAASGPPLSNPSRRYWREEKGCGDRVTEWLSVGQKSNLRFWHGNVLAIELRYWPDLEFWQRVIKGRPNNVIRGNF